MNGTIKNANLKITVRIQCEFKEKLCPTIRALQCTWIL